MTYRAIIKKLLDDNPHKRFKSWELMKVNTPYGWLGSSGDRIARMMAENGEIEHISRGETGCAEYWAKELKQSEMFGQVDYQPSTY